MCNRCLLTALIFQPLLNISAANRSVNTSDSQFTVQPSGRTKRRTDGWNTRKKMNRQQICRDSFIHQSKPPVVLWCLFFLRETKTPNPTRPRPAQDESTFKHPLRRNKSLPKPPLHREKCRTSQIRPSRNPKETGLWFCRSLLDWHPSVFLHFGLSETY